MELRKLDVQLANSHIKMLLSFMPEAFMGRGGERKFSLQGDCNYLNYCISYFSFLHNFLLYSQACQGNILKSLA